MIFAFLSALGNAAEVICDKLVLKERFVNYKNYLSISMIFIFFLTIVPFLFLGKIGLVEFEITYLFALAGIVLAGFLYNICYFFSLSHQNTCDIEPIAILAEPVTIIMAMLFFPSERSFIPVFFTSVAVIALVFSRLEKKTSQRCQNE